MPTLIRKEHFRLHLIKVVASHSRPQPGYYIVLSRVQNYELVNGSALARVKLLMFHDLRWQRNVIRSRCRKFNDCRQLERRNLIKVVDSSLRLSPSKYPLLFLYMLPRWTIHVKIIKRLWWEIRLNHTISKSCWEVAEQFLWTSSLPRRAFGFLIIHENKQGKENAKDTSACISCLQSSVSLISEPRKLCGGERGLGNIWQWKIFRQSDRPLH